MMKQISIQDSEQLGLSLRPWWNGELLGGNERLRGEAQGNRDKQSCWENGVHRHVAAGQD